MVQNHSVKEGIGGIEVIAWLSVMGDSFDCTNCVRTGVLCAKNDHDPEQVRQRLAEAKGPKSVPVIFKAESVGVCPVTLISPFAKHVAEAYVWWEKGQLGMLNDQPSWVGPAFRVYGGALRKAMDFKRKTE